MCYSLKEDWQKWERNLTEAEISLESRLREVEEREGGFEVEQSALLEAFYRFRSSLDAIDVQGCCAPDEEDHDAMETLNLCKVRITRVAESCSFFAFCFY